MRKTEELQFLEGKKVSIDSQNETATIISMQFVKDFKHIEEMSDSGWLCEEEIEYAELTDYDILLVVESKEGREVYILWENAFLIEGNYEY